MASMSPCPRPRGRRHRAVAAALVPLLLLAACTAEDDEPIGDDETPVEEETDAPTESPSEDAGPEAPDWASDAAAVRTVKEGVVGDLLDGVGWNQDPAGLCAYRPDVVAVYLADAAPNPPDPLAGYPPSDAADALLVSGVALYATAGDTPEVAAAVLREAGYLASPVHLVFPAPGRMFFPGTLPVPSEDGLAEADAATRPPMVAVVDTGGWDGMAGHAPAANDDLEQDGKAPDEQDPMGRPWTFGHGTFVADVLHRTSGDVSTVYRLRDDPSVGRLTELSVADQFARVAADGADVVNLSFGTFPCYVDVDDPMVPVTLLASAAALLGPEGVLVAAAGNSGDERLTMPAALAVTPDEWGIGWSAPAEDGTVGLPCPVGPLDDENPTEEDWRVTLDCLQAAGPTVVAVGATEPFSTTGPWVTTTRPGCRDGEHPGGWIEYPANPDVGADAVMLELGPVVAWCGSSFAAPQVAGEIATALRNGATVEEAVAGL